MKALMSILRKRWGKMMTVRFNLKAIAKKANVTETEFRDEIMKTAAAIGDLDIDKQNNPDFSQVTYSMVTDAMDYTFEVRVKRVPK